MVAKVADFMDSGIGFGPLLWVGQEGAKWSLILQQRGQMYQYDAGWDLCC